MLSTLDRLDEETASNARRLEKQAERVRALEISLAVLTAKVTLYAALIAAGMTGLIQLAMALFRK